jgi:hypothetical protein
MGWPCRSAGAHPGRRYQPGLVALRGYRPSCPEYRLVIECDLLSGFWSAVLSDATGRRSVGWTLDYHLKVSRLKYRS